MDKDKIHMLRVQKNKANGQRFINIPKHIRDLDVDDYVAVVKKVNNNK